MSNSKFNVRLLTEIAFMAALAFIISLIPNTVYGWIIVEIACIPILILSFRRGLTAGLVGVNDYWTRLYFNLVSSFS